MKVFRQGHHYSTLWGEFDTETGTYIMGDESITKELGKCEKYLKVKHIIENPEESLYEALEEDLKELTKDNMPYYFSEATNYVLSEYRKIKKL